MSTENDALNQSRDSQTTTEMPTESAVKYLLTNRFLLNQERLIESPHREATWPVAETATDPNFTQFIAGIESELKKESASRFIAQINNNRFFSDPIRQTEIYFTNDELAARHISYRVSITWDKGKVKTIKAIAKIDKQAQPTITRLGADHTTSGIEFKEEDTFLNKDLTREDIDGLTTVLQNCQVKQVVTKKKVEYEVVKREDKTDPATGKTKPGPFMNITAELSEESVPETKVTGISITDLMNSLHADSTMESDFNSDLRRILELGVRKTAMSTDIETSLHEDTTKKAITLSPYLANAAKFSSSTTRRR